MYGKGRVVILAGKTKEIFNVDVATLPNGSHDKVMVQCGTCGETFAREFRNVHQMHACSTHAEIDGEKHKFCTGCKQYRKLLDFNDDPSRYDGKSVVCRSCSEELMARIAKEVVSPPVASLVMETYLAQEGRCYFSGVPLSFDDGPNKFVIQYMADKPILVSAGMGWGMGNGWTQSSDTARLVQYMLGVLSNLAPYTRLECKKLSPNATIPTRKRTLDAGFDISSAVSTVIPPNSGATINTDIVVSAPEGFYYTIEGRSSLGIKGIVPFRGIIDSTYQGQLLVKLFNHSNEPYRVEMGDRIAQLILHPIVHADCIEVEEFTPVASGRSTAGFGSSGR